MVKAEPKKDGGKFHYVGLVTDKAVQKDLVKEGQAVDFWSEEDLELTGGVLYDCVLDLMSIGENQIVRFVKLIGPAVDMPF